MVVAYFHLCPALERSAVRISATDTSKFCLIYLSPLVSDGSDPIRLGTDDVKKKTKEGWPTLQLNKSCHHPYGITGQRKLGYLNQLKKEKAAVLNGFNVYCIQLIVYSITV